MSGIPASPAWIEYRFRREGLDRCVVRCRLNRLRPSLPGDWTKCSRSPLIAPPRRASRRLYISWLAKSLENFGSRFLARFVAAPVKLLFGITLAKLVVPFAYLTCRRNIHPEHASVLVAQFGLRPEFIKLGTKGIIDDSAIHCSVLGREIQFNYTAQFPSTLLENLGLESAKRGPAILTECPHCFTRVLPKPDGQC